MATLWQRSTVYSLGLKQLVESFQKVHLYGIYLSSQKVIKNVVLYIIFLFLIAFFTI